MAGVLFQKHHGSHPMDEPSSDFGGYLARLAPVLCFSLQLDMLPNSTPLIQAHGKVHGRVRRQAHGASMIWHTEEYMEEYALCWVGVGSLV